jgi:hypothetical protein
MAAATLADLSHLDVFSLYWDVYAHLAKHPRLVFVIPDVWRAVVTNHEDMIMCETQQVCPVPDWDAMLLCSEDAKEGPPVSASSVFFPAPWTKDHAHMLRGMVLAVLRHLRWSAPRRLWICAVVRKNRFQSEPHASGSASSPLPNVGQKTASTEGRHGKE